MGHALDVICQFIHNIANERLDFWNKLLLLKKRLEPIARLNGNDIIIWRFQPNAFDQVNYLQGISIFVFRLGENIFDVITDQQTIAASYQD
mgnify:CR=1 FL=1